VEGHDNFSMTEDIVLPFTPVPANRIRTVDLLSYIASHQDNEDKYKEEFYKVRSQLVAMKRLFMIGVPHQERSRS